ncbi:MAG: acyl-CoA dehydratase activase [Bacillota bacterium]
MMPYLGIDVGSVSTNIVLLDDSEQLVDREYLRTGGQPISALKKGLKAIHDRHQQVEITGVGTTGSGRNLAGIMVGADIIKNEITAHSVAASRAVPGVKTVLEIGGQDSKIIILREGIATDFAMNTVCAAGTGSFLDQQAHRLGIPIEEFGDYALKAKTPVRIAGRCSVFAESDMIHKQQLGHSLEEIIAGLCEALVRNYLTNIARGKNIREPVIFQGGVAANIGIKTAFEKALGLEVMVPENHDVMGAIGAARLAREALNNSGSTTDFKGFSLTEFNYRVESFECEGCPNHCEIINIYQDDQLIARWGARCPRWQAV